jgi:superfamily II DNA helicase RecQ
MHLRLSWAETRPGRHGNDARRHPSRWLAGLRPPASPGARTRGGGTGDATTSPAKRPKSGVPSGDPLFDALRAWRLEKARELGQPPYVIAHDTTLAAIAEARPTSIEALWRVKGIGANKADRYGTEILAVVAAAADEGDDPA